MSADRWTTCPACQKRHDVEVAQRNMLVSQAYGKVPPEEYERLKAETIAFVVKGIEDTLREDYEVGIDKGIFSVHYGAHCSAPQCGFNFQFEIEQPAVRPEGPDQ